MAVKESNPSQEGEKKQPFDEIVARAEFYTAATPQAPNLMEITGRVEQSKEKGKFILAVPTGIPNSDQILEMDIQDVKDYEMIFEDSTGHKTYRLRVPQDAPIKFTVTSAQLFGQSQLSSQAQQMQMMQLVSVPNGQAFGQNQPSSVVKREEYVKASDPIKGYDPIKSTDPYKRDPYKFDPNILSPTFSSQADPPLQNMPDPPQQSQPVQQMPLKITNGIKIADPKYTDPKYFDPKYRDPKYGDPKGIDPKSMDIRNIQRILFTPRPPILYPNAAGYYFYPTNYQQPIYPFTVPFTLAAQMYQ